MQTFIVAVSGGSGSGKSSFVDELKAALGREALCLRIDDYYLDLSHLDAHERHEVNFDDPEAIEWPLFLQHMKSLREGISVERPNYDFAQHVRTGHTLISPKEVLIIDGIFALCEPKLFPLVDLKLYVECDHDLRLARRLMRDHKQRGREISQVVEQYQTTVKPMHVKHIEPTKFAADLIIPWHRRNQRGVRMVASLIDGLMT